jgi:hypothetical protein
LASIIQALRRRYDDTRIAGEGAGELLGGENGSGSVTAIELFRRCGRNRRERSALYEHSFALSSAHIAFVVLFRDGDGMLTVGA